MGRTVKDRNRATVNDGGKRIGRVGRDSDDDFDPTDFLRADLSAIKNGEIDQDGVVDDLDQEDDGATPVRPRSPRR